MDPSRLEKNPYFYTAGDPVNSADPSGLIRECLDRWTCNEEYEADAIRNQLKRDYLIDIRKDYGYEPLFPEPGGWGVRVEGCVWDEGAWELWDLQFLKISVDYIAIKFAQVNSVRFEEGQRLFRDEMGPTTIHRWAVNFRSFALPGNIYLTDDSAKLRNPPSPLIKQSYFAWTVVHEFGHIWDYRRFWGLSDGLVREVREFECIESISGPISNCRWVIDPNEPPPGRTGEEYGRFMPTEDWADSFAFFVFENVPSLNYLDRPTFNPLSAGRRSYVESVIDSLLGGDD